MHPTAVVRNVRLFRLYALFAEPLFWGPVLIYSLEKLGKMSLSEIYYMESVAMAIAVLLDAPTGALADLIGRKRTIIIGRALILAEVILVAFMTSPVYAWVGNTLWVIGYTMQSGADDALLYESLAEVGMESANMRIQGQAHGARFGIIAFSSLATGFLASVNPRLPLLLSMPTVCIPLIAALFLTEPRHVKKYSIRQQSALLRTGAVFTWRSARIRWLIGFGALIAVASKLWFFTYNPYFEAMQLNLRFYGVIFFLLNIVAWISGHYAQTIERTLGEARTLTLMVLCIGLPILAMGLVPWWPLVYLVLIQNLVRGIQKPFFSTYLNRHIDSTTRATVLSVKTTVSNALAFVGLGAFGFVIGAFGLMPSLVALGITVLLAGALSYWTYTRIVH